MCRTRRRATAGHIRNSNADLIKLIVYRRTLQFNPFIFIGNFAKPQVCELDGDKSANMLYIHIIMEEQRSRIGHATIAHGSCEATGGAVAGVARAGGAAAPVRSPSEAKRGAGGV